MKRRTAIHLVRIIGRLWQASYVAHEDKRELAEDIWTFLAKKAEHLRRAAVKIEEEAAVDEMIRWGWWG